MENTNYSRYIKNILIKQIYQIVDYIYIVYLLEK